MSTPSPYQDEIRHTRLILLMEEAPFTNKYLQIELTRDAFKVVSDALWNTFEKTLDGSLGSLKLAEGEPVTLADTIQTFYD